MTDPKQLVATFLERVRSGIAPDEAGLYLADQVKAHQVQAENPLTVERTPDDYAGHVREMQDAYGAFTITIDELLADGDKVYARWTQHGHDQTAGSPSEKPVVQMTSAVYRVAEGKIVEYWIQIDRLGLQLQQADGEQWTASSAGSVAGDYGQLCGRLRTSTDSDELVIPRAGSVSAMARTDYLDTPAT